ncbi:MAG TPA: Gfo/Idh/MocA family oxidoreductase, partial [Giesbergeria sp.]|nr:Gfo/Idh/MocA family oxidoreductase [Giesbergeria sp.]
MHGLGSELALQVGHLLARGLRERCLLVALGFESRHAGGTLGEVYHFENHWPVHRPALRGVWREDPAEMGGLLYDIAPHLIDQT